MEYLCSGCLGKFPGLHSFLEFRKKVFKNARCICCKNAAHSVSLQVLSQHLDTCIKEEYVYSEKKQKNSFPLQEIVQRNLAPTYPYKQSTKGLDSSNKNSTHYDKHAEFIIKILKILLKSIKNINNQESYVQRKSEIMAWKDFENLIKTRKRFFFIDETDVLTNIKLIISELKLIDKISKGTVVYRARAFKKSNRIVNNLREMGPPLSEDIQHISNRMSPPGIPIFYCSLDADTALSEISDINRSRCFINRYKSFNIAQFKLLKDIIIVDLTKAYHMEIPEFFHPDQTERVRRRNILFIQEVAKEISRSIEKDGKEHTEYAPTQVFTEYIKHKMKDKDIKGVKYDSRKTGGINLALFLEQKEHFCDDDTKDKDNDYYLYFITNKDDR